MCITATLSSGETPLTCPQGSASRNAGKSSRLRWRPRSTWMDRAITFDRDDHPDYVPNPRKYPLVVDPIVGITHLTKVLMDEGSSLNIIYAYTLDLLGVRRSQIQPEAASFHGITPARGCIPSDRLTYLSALGPPPISARRPSHLRW
jgi:hypothetical protein